MRRAGGPGSDLVFPLNSPDNLTQAGSDAKHRDIVTSIIDCYLCPVEILMNENHDIAIAMSSSRAVLLPWLGVFNYINHFHCPGWGYLNI